MYNGVVLFRLKSTADLNREVIENLCNDFKSVVGIENYNVSIVHGSKDIIEFGVKDTSEISQSNIFYLILFSDLLTTQFSGDNYTIEYSSEMKEQVEILQNYIFGMKNIKKINYAQWIAMLTIDNWNSNNNIIQDIFTNDDISQSNIIFIKIYMIRLVI